MFQRQFLRPWIATVLEWWVRFGGRRIDAEDGADEVLRAFLPAIDRADPKAFRASLALRVRRHLKKNAWVRVFRRFVPGSGPELSGDSRVDLEPLPNKIAAALDKLGADDRAALILVDFEGLSIPDASELLGMPASVLDRRLELTRKRFDGDVRQSGVPLPEVYGAYLDRTQADPTIVDRVSVKLDQRLDVLEHRARAPSENEVQALSTFPRSSFKFLAGAGIGAGVLAAVMLSFFGEEAIPLAPSVALKEATPDAGATPEPELLEPPLVPPGALVPSTPDGAAPPSATVTAVEISGSLLAEDAERQIQTVSAGLSDCYAKTQTGLARKIVLSLFVVEGGVIRSTTAQPDDESSRLLASCADQLFKLLTLPLKPSADGRREFSIARVTLSP